jgi:gamma-glutamyltranspeptidase / glutathione hydrolase
MAVANTFTLERLWGSLIVVKDMGFLLNNNMFGFNLFPGITDTNGTMGTAPNTIAPGKRMVSSMTPTVCPAVDEINFLYSFLLFSAWR